MGYRGEDLDLRPPQSMGASGGPRGDMSFDQYDGPIWVDDLVLACCNHAYDVALAHRSAEVRIEHLLHAMARVDGAARILESLGVRENALRHETATVIASDIPVGLPNGKGHPRRSDELERVLRLASQYAGRNNSPAAVQDLLHVMLEVEPNLRGLHLLHKHSGNQASYTDVPGYRLEPRYTSYDAPPMERMRMVPAYYVENGGRQMMPEGGSSPTDHMQNSRLDALEKMVRGLGQDLASEHKTLNNVLATLQSDMRAQRDGIDQVSGRLGDGGGQSTERLENQLITLAKTTTAVTERLEQFERSLQTRLDVVETALQTTGGGELADLSPLANRLSSIEEALLSGGNGSGISSDQVRSLLAPITDRLSTLQDGLEKRQSMAAEALQGLSDRIADIERLLGEGGAVSNGNGRYDDDLSEVHEALMKLNANQHTLAEAVSAWRSDASGSGSGLDGRLASLESLSKNMERLHKVTVERYHRRNRLWYWLFGTDDWIAASWPSQAARVEEELRAFQCGLRDSKA